MNDLGVLIAGKIDIEKSIKQINADLQAITSQIKNLDISVGVDADKLREEIKKKTDVANKNAESIKLDVDMKTLEKEFSSIDNYVKDLKKNFGATTATVKQEVNAVDGTTKSWLVSLQKVGEATRRIKLSPYDGGVRATDMTIINDKEIQNMKLAEEMGKKREASTAKRISDEKRLAEAQAKASNANIERSRKEMETEKKKTDNLKHYIAMQKESAQHRRADLERRYGTVLTKDQKADLDGYINSMNRITSATPNARREIEKLNTNFRGIASNVATAGAKADTFGHQLKTALARVNMVAPYVSDNISQIA